MEDIRFFEKVILLDGRVPIGRNVLSSDVGGNGTTGSTIKILPHLSIVSVVKGIGVRQMIGPRLGVLAQLEKKRRWKEREYMTKRLYSWYLGRHGQRRCVVSLSINVVPAQRFGYKLAVSPVGLEVVGIARDGHRPVTEDLERNGGCLIGG